MKQQEITLAEISSANYSEITHEAPSLTKAIDQFNAFQLHSSIWR
jgi:hypothetical protein